MGAVWSGTQWGEWDPYFGANSSSPRRSGPQVQFGYSQLSPCRSKLGRMRSPGLGQTDQESPALGVALAGLPHRGELHSALWPHPLEPLTGNCGMCTLNECPTSERSHLPPCRTESSRTGPAGMIKTDQGVTQVGRGEQAARLPLALQLCHLRPRQRSLPSRWCLLNPWEGRYATIPKPHSSMTI